MNTKDKGFINFLIYRDPNDSMYTAVCLTFDIVEQGTDVEELKKSIEEAAILHLESVKKNKLDDSLLNRSAPKEYWRKLYEAMTAYETLIKENKKDMPAEQQKPVVSDIWNRSSRELVTA